MADPTPVSATVIAFPRACAPRPDAAPDPRLRLQEALASLEAALAGQRVAVADWREALGTLHSGVQVLGSSLVSYRDRLGALGARVEGLNGEARRLEAWADGVLAGVREPERR